MKENKFMNKIKKELNNYDNNWLCRKKDGNKYITITNSADSKTKILYK